MRLDSLGKNRLAKGLKIKSVFNLVCWRLGGPGVEGGVVARLLVPLPVVVVAHHVHVVLTTVEVL